ncbi:hypothetical protein IWW39_004870 [Coemansia spiralis]|uniref:Uncharacterized protein n=1 Tax=Coemansia spiralis TaxID=417178 RepID=A0A9W8GB25_9FUNG|nr:hypothetical protein IWW39_004870 [Coemansia spiralis]
MSVTGKHHEAARAGSSSSKLQANFVAASPSPQPPPSACPAHNGAVVSSFNADCPSTTSNTMAETSDRESSDEHYTRIQEMIDSLIKDADLALHSNPGHCQSRPSYSGTPEAPLSRDPVVSPDQLSSVSTVFDEPPPAFKFDADCVRKPVSATAHGHVMAVGSRSASKPMFKDSGYLSDLRPTRPASAHGSSVRLPRSRKQKSYVLATKSHVARADPEEADAESDSEVGAMSSFSHRGRNASRQSRQHHRRRNSGSYSDRHTDTQWAGRHRSDTMDSFMSNSSETCVSPDSRMSREYYRPPLSAQAFCAPSHTAADRLRTPTRAFFAHEGAGRYAESRMPPRLAAGCESNVHQFPSLPQDDIYQQQLQQRWLEAEEEKVRQSPRHHHYRAQFGEEYDLRSPTSPTVEGGQNNVPLIRRLRNSVTRAVLRSASFVDDSINDDIAAHADATRCTPTDLSCGGLSSRVRSSTSISEVSTVIAGPLSGTVFAHCESPRNRARGTLDSVSPMHFDGARWDSHARVQQMDARDFVPRSLPTVSASPSLWTRRNFGTEQVHGPPPVPGLQVNRDYQAAALSAQVPSTVDSQIRLPDSIEEYESSCEGRVVQQSAPSSGRDMTLRSADDNGASGLVSMISLLYWTLLFTLGALMLDSFLCQVAGKRVMGTVDKIAQLEANGGDSERNGEARNRRPGTRAIAGDGANVANTVGRFVRWYIEGPEEPLPSGSGVARTPAQPLRVRKSQTLRGSFKHGLVL